MTKLFSFLPKIFLKLTLIMTLTIASTSCSNRDRDISKSKTDKEFSKEDKDDQNHGNEKNNYQNSEVRIYFENSGSMQGYVGQNALDFKNSVINAIGELKHEFNNNIKLYFITNTKIEGIPRDVMTFCNNIDVTTFSGASSRMENMISTILDSTTDNVLSVFVSDCIFSLGNDQDALNELAQVKGIIKDKTFEKIRENNKSKSGFGIRMYQMMCGFNGKYFNRRNGVTLLPGVKRPVYFLTMGSTALLRKISRNEHLIFRKSDGLTQSLECNSMDYTTLYSLNESSIYCTLLGSTFKKGKFKTKKNKDRLVAIEGLKPSKSKEGPAFQVAVALDLSELPVSEEYKLDKSNYSINSNDGYEIVEIKKIEEIDLKPTDKQLLKAKNESTHLKASHVVVISSNESAYPTINLKLLRNTPNGFKASYGGIADDENISASLRKTFGLEYLVSGFDEAFSHKAKEGGGEYLYFNLKVPIKAGTSSAGAWIIFFIIISITGFGIYIYLKNKKR
jgi:hypothetical protein